MVPTTPRECLDAAVLEAVCVPEQIISFFPLFFFASFLFPSFPFWFKWFFSFFKPQIIWKYKYFMARKKENPCKFIAPRRKMLWCLVHTDGTIWWNTGKRSTDAAVSLASALQNMPKCEVTFFFLYLPDVFLTSLWCSDSWCPHANPTSVTPCHGQPYLHLQRLDVLALSLFLSTEKYPSPQQELTSQGTPRSWGRWRKRCGGNLARRATRRAEMAKRVGLSSC